MWLLRVKHRDRSPQTHRTGALVPAAGLWGPQLTDNGLLYARHTNTTCPLLLPPISLSTSLVLFFSHWLAESTEC